MSLIFQGGCLQFFGGCLQFFVWGGVSNFLFGGCLQFFFQIFFLFFFKSFFPKISSGMHQPSPPRRSMRGRYASYWNAFLLKRLFEPAIKILLQLRQDTFNNHSVINRFPKIAEFRSIYRKASCSQICGTIYHWTVKYVDNTKLF